MPFQPGDHSANVHRALRNSSGDAVDFSFDLSYRWDFQRLPTEPIDPRSVEERLLDRLARIDGRYSAGELGSQAEAELRQMAAELPIVVVSMRADYLSPAFEALKEADGRPARSW